MERREKDEKQGQGSQDWAVMLCWRMAAQNKSDEGREGRKRKRVFPPPSPLHHHCTLPLCLAVWPIPSPPLGLIKQTVGPTRLVGGDEGRGDLSSAGINLCDRGLLDESDHPCWLAGWMEPGVWGDVAEGKVTARRELNFKGCLHSGFQL